MIARFVSLLIVLAIVGLVAWGVSLIEALPPWAARLGYAVCAACAAILIANFVLGLTGHPWFEYGGSTPP